MTVDLDHWQKREYTGMKPGLERINKFLESCGNPHRSFKAVHVAGTNGKGSVSLMAAAMIERSGWKTGLYVSPHIRKINERLRVNSELIPDSSLARLVSRFSGMGKKCGLSFFEFMTGIAFAYFADKKVDVAVLETGLGGRFDATNTVQSPLVSVITGIDFDHQDILGGTLRAIAFEKAGIIKPGCPVVCGAVKKEALETIRSAALDRNAKLFLFDKDFCITGARTDWARRKQYFRYNGMSASADISLSLLGAHQAANASVALAACELVSEQWIAVPMKRASASLSGLEWPARFQILKSAEGNTFIIDGCHNPGAIKTFVETWRSSPWRGEKPVLIFGMLKDKDCRQAVRLLSEIAGSVIIAPVKSPRDAGTAFLERLWKKYLPAQRLRPAGSAREALKLARSPLVAVAGSLYLAGEILNILHGKDCYQ